MAPIVQDLTDQLWKYQLRREHATLLEQLKILTKQRSNDNMEIKNRVIALQHVVDAHNTEADSRIGALETHLGDCRPLCEKRFDELSQSLEKVKKFFEAEQHKINIELSEARERMSSEIQSLKLLYEEFKSRMDNHSEADLKRISISTRSSSPLSESASSSQRLQIIESSADVQRDSEHPATADAVATSMATTITSTPTAIAPSTRSQNVANSGVRKSRRRQHKAPSSPISQHAKLPEPSIEQRRCSLATYIKRTHEIYLNLAPTHHNGLAAQFIAGMQNTDEQKRLVGALEERRLIEWTNEDDLVVRCKWLEIRDVLRTIGMGGLGAVVTPARKRQAHKHI